MFRWLPGLGATERTFLEEPATLSCGAGAILTLAEARGVVRLRRLLLLSSAAVALEGGAPAPSRVMGIAVSRVSANIGKKKERAVLAEELAVGS